MKDEFCPKNVKEWELWLKNNHDKGNAVWLIQYKKGTAEYNISYPDALDLALCYGWIDSTIKPVDENKYKRYFTKRNKNSVWSKVNKNKISKLIENGKMAKYGFEAIERAKENGSYYILDDAENGIIPPILKDALNDNLKAKKNFEFLSKREQRYIIYTLAKLKTEVAKKNNLKKIIDNLDF